MKSTRLRSISLKAAIYFLSSPAFFTAQAQTRPQPYKNSLTAGLEYMALDAPDDLGWRYTARYSRHLFNDRLVVSGTAGFGWASNERWLTGSLAAVGTPRERVTLDATVAFDFIRHRRHALRLGAGPSLWYRDEDRLMRAHFRIYSPERHELVSATWRNEKEWNTGYNLLAEYEFAVTDRWLASCNFKYAQTGGVATPLLGLGVGCRL